MHGWRTGFVIILTTVTAITDSLSVTALSPNPTTAIIVPPDIPSVTLSWNYTLDVGEIKVLVITVYRIKGGTTNRLVDYRPSNPNYPRVKEAFRSRMNFTISGNKINLVINKVTADDGNGFLYDCQVISDWFDIESARVELVVRVAAHNVATNCSRQILGKAMTCNCTADGDPPISYQWRAPSSTLLHSGSSYTTPLVDQSLHGSYYTCVASNGYGPEARGKTTLFNVLDKPSQVIITAKPNATVLAGQKLSLRCNADGNPTPVQFEWKLNAITQKGTYQVLVISKATTGKSGTYSCKAINLLGSATGRKNITVMRSPCNNQLCQNGGTCRVQDKDQYKCYCAHGWSGQNCTNRIVYSIIDAELSLNLTWDEALSDSYSQEYQSLRMLLKTAISESYETTSLLTDVLVQGFRKGSVIAIFQLIFAEEKSKSMQLLQTFLQNHNFTLGGVKVHSLMQVGRRTDSECTNNSTATVAVLATLTTLLFLALICLTIYVWWKVFKKDSLKAKQEQYEMPTHVIQNPAVLPKARTQRTIDGNSNQEPSIQKQYMQLLPITSRGHSSETTKNTTSSPDYMALSPSSCSWEVARDKITVNKVIGKGAFGQVAKGTAMDLPGKKGKTTVAIKMIKGNAPSSDRKDLLSELNLMKQLKPHPCVIRLLGCVTEDDPLMVIIEYIPYGDLLGYLRKSRGLNDTYYKDPDVKPRTNLTSKQLIKLAWQIADGMSYLAYKKIVHRDLAARNVLVGENEQCKVTDFGLARDVQEEGFYEKKTKGRLPVKWMAFESLIHRTYSTQTDVWSYGVVMYELFTIGGCPYPKIPGREIPKLLEQGYRMPKPQHVDQHLYQVMIDCWQEDPGARPTFKSLRIKMKSFEGDHQTYVNLKNYNKKLYDNVEDLDE